MRISIRVSPRFLTLVRHFLRLRVHIPTRYEVWNV